MRSQYISLGRRLSQRGPTTGERAAATLGGAVPSGVRGGPPALRQERRGDKIAYTRPDDLPAWVAELLEQGKVVGWMFWPLARSWWSSSNGFLEKPFDDIRVYYPYLRSMAVAQLTTV